MRAAGLVEDRAGDNEVLEEGVEGATTADDDEAREGDGAARADAGGGARAAVIGDNVGLQFRKVVWCKHARPSRDEIRRGSKALDGEGDVEANAGETQKRGGRVVPASRAALVSEDDGLVLAFGREFD